MFQKNVDACDYKTASHCSINYLKILKSIVRFLPLPTDCNLVWRYKDIVSMMLRLGIVLFFSTFTVFILMRLERKSTCQDKKSNRDHSRFGNFQYGLGLNSCCSMLDSFWSIPVKTLDQDWGSKLCQYFLVSKIEIKQNRHIEKKINVFWNVVSIAESRSRSIPIFYRDLQSH